MRQIIIVIITTLVNGKTHAPEGIKKIEDGGGIQVLSGKVKI
jgi:hypothetical protein